VITVSFAAKHAQASGTPAALLWGVRCGNDLLRTLVTCYKPDGSGAGVDLWRNSEFDMDFEVHNWPLRQGATFCRIDKISSSVPDDTEVFHVPPSGYFFPSE
jgi:hypothetical protein